MRRIGYNNPTMRRKIISLIVFYFVVALPVFTIVTEVQASTVSASQLISWMNSMRMANGFSAMVEDQLLNNSAASAAYQMYAQGGCGHPGGKMERIAASGYGALGTFFATENIACAVSADLAWFQQYNVWGDPLHQYPATEAQYTRIGAFAYTAPNGTTYYVLHAASAPGGSSSGSSSNKTTSPTQSSQWISPVLTSTPNEDGSIYHIVQYGQALSTIAEFYGVTINQITTLNKLTSDKIYEGQKLTIRLAPTVTITPSRTPTVVQPTRTPTQTLVPNTPRPTRTITPTPRPSLADALPKIDRQWLGLGLVVISAVGFFIVLFFTFLKPMRKK